MMHSRSEIDEPAQVRLIVTALLAALARLLLVRGRCGSGAGDAIVALDGRAIGPLTRCGAVH